MAEPTPDFGGPNPDEEVYGDETETNWMLRHLDEDDIRELTSKQ
jgi:hypothetical protein